MTSLPLEETRAERAVPARAFGWLADNAEYLLPAAGDTQPAEVFRRKALGEVALLVGLAARVPGRVPPDTLTVLLDCVAAVAGRRSYKDLIARDRRAVLLYAATFAGLRMAGREDRESLRAIEQVVNGRYATAIERLAYRHLDLLHTLDAAGIRHRLPTVADALRLTLLVQDPSVVDIRDLDAYAVTHTVFYASGFGTTRVSWPQGYQHSQAVELLDALLMLYRVRANPDLVAELICSHACLAVYRSEELDRGWSYLARLQCPDGRVPGPPGIVLPELFEDDPAAREWATSYHTTVVAALMGLLLDREPSPDGQPPRRHRPSRADRQAVLDGVRAALRAGVSWISGASRAWPVHESVPALAAACLAAQRVGTPPELEGSLRRVAALIDSDGAGELDWSLLGADVVFAFARGLDACRVECRGLWGFLDSVTRAIEHAPDALGASPAALRELADLGLPAALADAKPGVVGDPVAVARRFVEPADERSSGPEKPGELEERLAAALIDACRQYSLGAAAAVMRGLLALGWGRHRVVCDAAVFLTQQQTASGAFGYTASDDEQVAGADQRRWTQGVLVALAEFVGTDGAGASASSDG